MSKSPAFQFYPDDFLGSGKVGTMTPDEVGVYVMLLCLDWNENGFTFDPKKLARWCRTSRAKFQKAWAAVGECFVEKDGRMFNPRLEMERAKQAENRAKKVAAAESRWNAPASAPAMPVECPPIPSPSPVEKQQLSAAPEAPRAPESVSPPEPPPRPRKGSRRSRIESGAESEGAHPGFVYDRLEAEWTTTVGAITRPRFRAAMKPVLDAHSAPAVLRGMRRCVEEAKEKGRSLRVEWFAGEAARWIASADGLAIVSRPDLFPHLSDAEREAEIKRLTAERRVKDAREQMTWSAVA